MEITRGIDAQLPHISIVLHLGIAENAAIAIARDSERRSRILRMARKRGPNVDFAKIPSEENDDAKRYLKSDLCNGGGRSLGSNPVDATRQNTKGETPKGGNPIATPRGNGKRNKNTAHQTEATPGFRDKKGRKAARMRRIGGE